MDIGSLVHLSVDDVIDSFKWICENRPVSAFDVSLFSTLKVWHERYGLSCDMYVLDGDGEFSISMCRDEYWEELRKESEWLRFCRYKKKRDDMSCVSDDIGLDCLSDGTSVDDLLGKTEEIVSRYWDRKLEIFFHECKFAEIKEKIEKYWVCFENLKMDIYIDSSVLIGNEMYFYSRNGLPCLFHEKIDEDVVDVFVVLKRSGLFASMHYYSGKIWMIPRGDGDYVVVIDIESKHQIYMELPDRFKGKGGFMKGIQSGKYLWAVSKQEKAFLRIDMESFDADVIDMSVLAELSFDSKSNRNFMCICADSGKIYAFRDACSCNLVLDEKSMEISICPMQTDGDYVVVSEGKVYAPPTHEQGAVRIYSTDGKLLHEIDISQDAWSGHEIYAFWCCTTQERVYMLPHEANGILEIEKDNDRLRVIYPELASYRTYRPYKKFTGYEVHFGVDFDVVMSHFGNAYLIVDKKTGEIKRECYTKIPFSWVEKKGWKFAQRIVNENEDDLMLWLEFVKTDGGIDIKRL